ncbi:MAG: ATP-binding protein [Acidimicrobiales bacterium]
MSASRDFDAKATDVRAARMFAVDASAGWGVKLADVETVVGELAANAYVHAQTSFTVSLTHFDSRVSIEVADANPHFPEIAEDQPVDSLHGRGLHMVQAIATAWGARPTDVGKVVWAELAARNAVAS